MASITWSDVTDYAAELSTVAVGVQTDILALANGYLKVDCFGGESGIKLKIARINIAAHFGLTLGTTNGAHGQVLSEELGDMKRQYGKQAMFADSEFGSTKYGRAYLTILAGANSRGGFVL